MRIPASSSAGQGGGAGGDEELELELELDDEELLPLPWCSLGTNSSSLVRSLMLTESSSRSVICFSSRLNRRHGTVGASGNVVAFF